MKIKFTITLSQDTVGAFNHEGVETGGEIAAHLKNVLAEEVALMKEKAEGHGFGDDDEDDVEVDDADDEG